MMPEVAGEIDEHDGAALVHLGADAVERRIGAAVIDEDHLERGFPGQAKPGYRSRNSVA